MTDESGLSLPSVRCLTKEQAAAYLGIGVTLLLHIGPPPIKFGRRSVRWKKGEKGDAHLFSGSQKTQKTGQSPQ